MAANKMVWMAVAVVLAVGAGYLALSRGSQVEWVASEQALAGTTAASADVRPAAGPSVASRPLAGGASSAEIARKYQCPSERLDCKQNPNVAATQTEAEWLVTHGYPTLEQIRDLKTRSTADYKAEYQRTGSKVAESLYAMSLAENGEALEAAGVMALSAQTGNVYAYYVLSDIYRRTEEIANLVTSAAYLRAAYLAGDIRAGTKYAERFGHLSPMENSLADEEAYELFKNFGKGRNYPRP